jgi:hypothetical protein
MLLSRPTLTPTNIFVLDSQQDDDDGSEEAQDQLCQCCLTMGATITDVIEGPDVPPT